MKYFLSNLCLFLILNSLGFAQTGSEIAANQQGLIRTHILSSETLEAERTVNVWLPPNYNPEAGESYPVAFVLDGQRWFLYASGLVNSLAEVGTIPDCIVLGIETADAPRYGFFADEKRISAYLLEVYSWADSNFKTNGERLLLSWQFASAFSLRHISRADVKINAAFLASPYPATRAVMEALNLALARKDMPLPMLYFAANMNEGDVVGAADRIAATIDESGYDSTRWHYETLTRETKVEVGHLTTPIETLYKGLRWYYHDFPMLDFESPDEFRRLGGMKYVDLYYQKRAERYDLEPGIPDNGKFGLVRLGLNNDDIDIFHTFMNRFKESGFLDGINLGWGSNYAAFYLKHDRPEDALWVYEHFAARFQEDARPVNGLGKAWLKMGDKAKAKEFFQKAVELAEASNDRNLEAFKADLNSLK